MRGGAAAAVPFCILGSMEVPVVEMWRARLRELSARQMALIGALLLCGISGIALLWPDDTETLVTLQQASAPPRAPEIAGLSAAAKRSPLRNPFSDAHERAHEIPSTIATAEQKNQTLPPNTLPVPSPLPPTAALPPAPPPAPLVLRGVVTGADGVRLAILARGAEGAALGIGEVWQGYTLRALSDRSATLDSASGTITLTRE